MALVVEYLVVPKFLLASRHFYTLEHLNPIWLSAGIAVEAGSLFAYSVLTKVLLPPGSLGLSVLWRIDLAGLAIAHVVPGGTAGSATLGYRLLTTNGVSGQDAGFAMATQGMGSAVVLNVMLWIALIVSIPFAGVHPGYVLAALVGTLVLAAFAALIFFFTRGEESAVRLVRYIGERVPHVTPDQLERLVRHIGQALRQLATDRARLWGALRWAATNWLLDATSLWCFLAALHVYLNPVYVFVAWGVGNVVAALPITPSGLGVVETVVPFLLHSLGANLTAAGLAVIGWRLFNFWVPIPVGAGAYVSLRVGLSSTMASRRAALRQMAAESRDRSEEFDSDAEPLADEHHGAPAEPENDPGDPND
jgi:uncharacterized protein (TIRG00374 family)